MFDICVTKAKKNKMNTQTNNKIFSSLNVNGNQINNSLNVFLEKETEKAFLFEVLDAETLTNKKMWMPKSCVKIVDDRNIDVVEWFAKKTFGNSIVLGKIFLA